MMRMPFGRHQGKELEDVPLDYLTWALTSDYVARRPVFKRVLENEIDRRINPPPPPSSGPNVDILIKKWYRECARVYHPDSGGSHEAMKAINDAHERLKRLATELL